MRPWKISSALLLSVVFFSGGILRAQTKAIDQASGAINNGDQSFDNASHPPTSAPPPPSSDKKNTAKNDPAATSKPSKNWFKNVLVPKDVSLEATNPGDDKGGAKPAAKGFHFGGEDDKIHMQNGVKTGIYGLLLGAGPAGIGLGILCFAAGFLLSKWTN
jgi:hypothetical protein